MPEMDAFERRLSNALVAYADEMPSRVDAAAVARRVEAERARGAWRAVLPAMPRLAWILIAAVLIALVAGLVAVGAGLVERLRVPPATDFGIALVAPIGGGDAQAVTGFDGQVWVREQSGLARLDPAAGTVRTWDAGDDLAVLASGIAPARGGGVWLLSGQAIRRFDGEQIGEPLRLPAEAKDVVAVAEAPNSTLWAATGGGLFSWRSGTWTVVPGQAEGVSAAALAIDARGNVWVSLVEYPGPVFRGIARNDGHTWTTFAKDLAGAPLPEMISLAADDAGGVWAGTRHGLAHFDGSAWTTFGADQLGGDGVWFPAVGPAGDVWAVTTDSTGQVHVARFRDGAWTRWGPGAGLPAPEASGGGFGMITVTSEGPVVAVASAIDRFVGDHWQQAWRDPAGDPRRVVALAPGVGAEAWGLTWRLSGDRTTQLWHHTSSGASLESLPAGVSSVNKIAIAPDGTAWLATDAGVAERSDGRWAIVDPRPAVGMTIAPDGTGWAMGADSSLHTIRQGFAGWVVRDVPGSGSTDGTVRASSAIGPNLAVDEAGHVWANGGQFGYSHAPGLRRFDGRQWQPMVLPGTSAETVFGNVVATPDGSVWVTIDATAYANGCCTPADPAAQVARFDGSGWTVYGSADGLPADTTGRGLAVTPDGVVWLSTTTGIYRFANGGWRLAVAVSYPGGLVAAPDGALWTSGGPIMRIADPPH